jgi:hypothetical protein
MKLHITLLILLITLILSCSKNEKFVPRLDLKIEMEMDGEAIIVNGTQASNSKYNGFFSTTRFYESDTINRFEFESFSLFSINNEDLKLSLEFQKYDNKDKLEISDLLDEVFYPREIELKGGIESFTIDSSMTQQEINSLMNAFLNRPLPDTVTLSVSFDISSSSIESFNTGRCDSLTKSKFRIISSKEITDVERLNGKDVILIKASFELELCNEIGEKRKLNGELTYYFGIEPD